MFRSAPVSGRICNQRTVHLLDCPPCGFAGGNSQTAYFNRCGSEILAVNFLPRLTFQLPATDDPPRLTVPPVPCTGLTVPLLSCGQRGRVCMSRSGTSGSVSLSGAGIAIPKTFKLLFLLSQIYSRNRGTGPTVPVRDRCSRPHCFAACYHIFEHLSRDNIVRFLLFCFSVDCVSVDRR